MTTHKSKNPRAATPGFVGELRRISSNCPGVGVQTRPGQLLKGVMLPVPFRPVNGSTFTIRVGGDNLLSLSAEELRHLREQLTMWLAMNRPGPQANAWGVTPRWLRDRVQFLDAVRKRLEAVEGVCNRG